MSGPDLGAGVNGIECLTCGATIVSTHRHHYVSCQCPDATRVSVDGGADYSKRAYSSASNWRELSTGEVRCGTDESPLHVAVSVRRPAVSLSPVDRILAPGVLPDALRLTLLDYRARLEAALEGT